MWIVQELTVAKRIVAHCGDNYADSSTVLFVQSLLEQEIFANLFEANFDTFKVSEDDNFQSMALRVARFKKIHVWKDVLTFKSLSFFDCLLYHYHRNVRPKRHYIRLGIPRKRQK